MPVLRVPRLAPSNLTFCHLSLWLCHLAGSWWLSFKKILPEPGIVVHTCNSSCFRGRSKRIKDKSARPYLKNKLKGKGLRGVAQAIEHLPGESQ
jgi:hypothetical protein